MNVNTHIPLTDMDIRRYYLDGSKSIVENLPIPAVKTINDHAFVSLKDVISHVLEFDIGVEPILKKVRCNTDISRRTETVIAQNIYERAIAQNCNEPILILPITEWSDDFEPNTQEKQNRGSVWVKCITVGLRHDSSVILNTYVLAIGDKNSDHECIQKIFKNDLLELKQKRTYFYSKKLMIYLNLTHTINPILII